MALYKTDALLCDHCAVSKGKYYGFGLPKQKDMAVIPYPWLTSEHSTIDPSLLVEKEDDLISFNANLLEDVDGIDNEQWMNEGYQLPAPRLLLKDNEGNDWLLLTSYDGHTTEATDGTIKDLFLYTNAGFIKKDEVDAYKEWAKEQNFHGRWMPECRNGSTDYLWNEYPWAETYIRQQKEWDMEHSYNGPGFRLKLSYEAQLQENWFGLDDSNVDFHYVGMPNHHIMNFLKLYTAERGVVREISTNEIVSINIQIGSLRGLAMRKEYLLKYLTNYGYVLVYYSLGEKLVRMKNSYQNLGKNYDLSGSFLFENGYIKEIKPMHISQTFPPRAQE